MASTSNLMFISFMTGKIHFLPSLNTYASRKVALPRVFHLQFRSRDANFHIKFLEFSLVFYICRTSLLLRAPLAGLVVFCACFTNTEWWQFRFSYSFSLFSTAPAIFWLTHTSNTSIPRMSLYQKSTCHCRFVSSHRILKNVHTWGFARA